MSDNDRLRVGIVGCGNIAGKYIENLVTYPELELIGVTDIDSKRAADFAQKYNCRAFASLDDLLAGGIDLAANLTSHCAHVEVTTKCLEAGKHVFSEKPMATTYEDAAGLVALAKRKGLRLGSAPFTLMGEGQQTAWKLVREGRLGTVRVAFAEVNWGRIESWHPAPGPFYKVGALYDVGVYPLTILTSIFGPARRVTSFGKLLHPDRVTREGVAFHIDTPDFAVTLLELKSGVLVRLTTDFYVGPTKQVGLELHGDKGSLVLTNWHDFNGAVQFTEFGGKFQDVPLVKEPFRGVPWGLGIRDMAQAILEDRPHRFTGDLAAHVVEILNAATQSMASGQPVAVTSDFPSPAPMEWAL